MALGEVPRNEPTWFLDDRVAAKPLHALGFSKGTSRSRRVRSFVLFHFSVTTESHRCLGQCCPICKAVNLCYAHRHCVSCLGWPLAPQNTQRGKPLKQGDHTVGSSFLWTVVTQTGKPAHGPHMLASGVFVEENEESHLRPYNQSTVCTYSALLNVLSLYNLVKLYCYLSPEPSIALPWSNSDY